MRRAKYSAKKVRLPNVPVFGFNVQEAKPGHWVMWDEGSRRVGRVLGRIEHAQFNDGNLEDVRGWLAVMQLSDNMTHAYIRWIDPARVVECYEKPPAALLAWITGDEWAKRGADVARYVAMSEHGTTCNEYIATRDDPKKPYNRNADFAKQYEL